MIEISGLKKVFGSLVAVDDLNLIVPKGEIFALLGPNAAGKTTTIRMMTGLLKPTAGTVKICGYDIQKNPIEARSKIAYVPDFPFLYEKLTPEEFFEFIGMIFRIPYEKISKHVKKWTEIFNLKPYLNELIENLSHGTRQRVAIVAGLLHEPEVFILDEPTVGLDPQHTKILKDTLKEEIKRGMTVFISTHQLSFAEAIADQVGIMHQGRLIAVGTPQDLRSRVGKEADLEEVFLVLTNELRT